MIVAISLDPAVHVSYETKRVVPGTTHQVGRVRYRAGGRGPAVARMLHTFGHEVVAAGLAGGTAGELIRAELARIGVPTQFTPIAMESRRVVEVTDASAGTTTSFAEPSPYITTEELGRLAVDYRGLLADATAAVLCGTLPSGLPAETYGSLATYAAESGVPVVLDAGGGALGHAVARHPALVIPETAADGGLLGDPAALVASGAAAVAVLSGDGVGAVTPDGEWAAALPESRTVAASRDALVAGFVPGIALNWSWPDTLAHAVALAAASGPGGDVDLDAYERLLPAVVVTSRAARGRQIR
jgi:tagatose 6-phosphate kinase